VNSAGAFFPIAAHSRPAPSRGPSGGVADSLDEAKAEFRAGGGGAAPNPKNRQTGATIEAHGVFRSGRGRLLTPYGR
jgi:hypothetical protein